MEVGHNVMHGQYDWMRDPALNSKMFEWDTACPSDQWRHSHNYMHHTFTNIVDKDRDIGYGILRMDPAQKWNPYYLGNPLWAFLLMTFFEYGVALHDLEVENVLSGKRVLAGQQEAVARYLAQERQADAQGLRAVPGAHRPPVPVDPERPTPQRTWCATSGRTRSSSAATSRRGVATFTEEECEDETRGHWYVRQMLGSANITGSPLFHILSGNLSHQIEHHLFPDIPAFRYPQIAAEVRALCEKYGLPYNTGGLSEAARLDLVEDLPARPARRTPVRRAGDYRGCRAACGRVAKGSAGMVGRFEIGKDVAQELAESAAVHVGRISTIVTTAVRDVAREVGSWASEAIEMRDAAARAQADSGEDLPGFDGP